MFSSRKPLAIALTLVIMLAMLVPATMAAPEWVHGVNITSPTQAAPASVNPAMSNNSFVVKYDLSILPTQVDDIGVTIRVVEMQTTTSLCGPTTIS